MLLPSALSQEHTALLLFVRVPGVASWLQRYVLYPKRSQPLLNAVLGFNPWLNAMQNATCLQMFARDN